ncbi:NAD-dependent epimerase/dehydratase family protein [Candidatus Pelagibacter sp.]|nr:NAD-dependent epimerase/dehydratase family protein [Candidatus Pelagibacter sp.]
MKKKIIIVTGGAGFIGSNLIEYLIRQSDFDIISLDNYSTGTKKNHIKNSRIKYLVGDTSKINDIIKLDLKKISCVFHFGEFSRIYQSFAKFDQCYKSNTTGTQAVINFCLKNNIKLIYSATSASLGNRGNDKNLSPYAFTKSKNLELLENFKKWFNFKFEIIYFYNVYGPRQIKQGDMATVIGIFEQKFLDKKPLTVVKPGTQTRRFTHISDTVKVCYEAWKKNKCAHYSISNKKSYSILNVAKMFKSKIIILKARKGERFSSALTKISQGNHIIQRYGKINLKDYIRSFISDKNYEN